MRWSTVNHVTYAMKPSARLELMMTKDTVVQVRAQYVKDRCCKWHNELCIHVISSSFFFFFLVDRVVDLSIFSHFWLVFRWTMSKSRFVSLLCFFTWKSTFSEFNIHTGTDVRGSSQPTAPPPSPRELKRVHVCRPFAAWSDKNQKSGKNRILLKE